MSLYTVISPKEEYYTQYEDFILQQTKLPIDLCIKENGVHGNHPHMNIIWHGDISIRTDDFTRKLKRYMKDLPGIEEPVVIRTKRITDSDYLIGGYLTKESGYTVLIDSGLYDLESLKQKVSKKFESRSRWKGIMSYGEAALDIIDYCEDKDYDYLKQFTSQDQTGVQYLKDSRGCKRVMAMISKEYRVQVLHLFRKAEDIHLQVLSLLVESHLIEF